MSNLKDKILEDILKTGFVTELQVGSVLRKREWTTSHGDTYEDLDTGKSREIDIIATLVKYDEESDLFLEFSLVIDVKRMKKRPWVIFSTEKTISDTEGWRILNSGYNYKSLNQDKFTSTIFTSDDLDEMNFKSEIDRYGIAFHESFKSPSETSQAFQSLIGASKAAWDRKEKHHSKDELKDFNKNEPTELNIFIPVIVLDGELFEVSIDKEGELQLHEEKMIQVDLNYSSSNYSKRDLEFFPDIVQIDYFEDYLTQTEAWAERMFKNFRNRLLLKYRK